MAKDPSSLYDWTLAYIIVPIPIRYNSSKPGASTLPHIGPLSSRCLKKILIQKKQFIKNYIPTMVHTTSVWPTIKALYTFVCSEIWAVLDVTQLAKAVLETFCTNDNGREQFQQSTGLSVLLISDKTRVLCRKRALHTLTGRYYI